MADLSPDPLAKVRLLLPRLASDRDGEVVATVAAIRRTLDRAGLDLHDLAARLTDDAGPIRPEPSAPRPDPGNPEVLAEAAAWLRRNAWAALRPKDQGFVETAEGLLAAGRTLSIKQVKWLIDLRQRHDRGRS